MRSACSPGLGASPLSNELLAGVVFAVLTIVYWIVALAGKLGEGARKGFAAVVAVMAIVFACFTGAAYMMETIVSWNTPMVPVAVLGFSLLGGVSLGVLVLALSGALEDAAKGGFKMAALAVLVVGLVLGVVGLLVQVMSVSGMGNALVDGADLVTAASAPCGSAWCAWSLPQRPPSCLCATRSPRRLPPRLRCWRSWACSLLAWRSMRCS